MKYTRSKDGKQRVNLRATFRVTREEVAEIRKTAKLAGHDKLSDFLNYCLKRGYFDELESIEEEQKYLAAASDGSE